MADRSIVVRMRAEIGDLKAKSREAGQSLKQVGQDAQASAKKSVDANEKVSRSDKIRAAVRKQAADEEIRANEKLRMQQEKYGKTTAFLLNNQDSLNKLSAASATAGLALAAGVGVAVKSYADFDKQMSAVAATGSDARSNLDALRETAIEAGADTAFSAGEAAAGIENLLKAGVSAQDVMGGGLKGALDLAAAGQLAVGDAAEIAATAMTQFRLSGEDVPHIADLLAAGAGKAQGEVSDLAGALKQSGLVASQFGLSIEETVGTLSAFASAGLLGSDAGTSLRTMLLRLANPADETAETMDRLGIAAYDAQGNFVGVANLAQQLQDRLGGLTQAQRDAALAQIFGSDAIRAANVLYEQGASGIQSWIDQTNDAGYASEVAAIQTDNLAGDLERLTGSLDSAFLKSGSGANEALRGLVQGLEGAVDAVGSLDPMVLQAGLGIAALGSAALLGFAGIVKIATGVADTRAAMRDLADTSPKAAAGLSRVGRALGGIGAAVGAGMILGQVAQAVTDSFSGRRTGELTEYANALVSLGNGGEGAANALNKLLDDAVWAEGGTQVVDVATAFKQLNENMNGFNQVVAAGGDIFQYESALRAVQGQFKAIDEALTELEPGQASKAFREIARSAAEAGVSNEQLIQTFPQYKAQLEAVATQMGITTLTAEHYARWMGGEIPPAVQQAAAGNEDLSASLTEVSGAGTTAAQVLEELTAAMYEQAQQALAASSAQIGFEQAIDDLSDSIKENGRTLDTNTEKGRANKGALDSLADSTLGYVQALNEQGGKSAEAAAAMARGTSEFIKNAQAAGMTAREATALAVSYGLIPSSVSTDIAAPGAAATKQQANEVSAAIKDIPDAQRSEIISAWMSGGYDAAMAAIRNLPRNTTTTITTRRLTIYETRGSAPAVGGPRAFANEGFAGGGQVVGPGTGTSDSVPILASNGEVVIKESSVRSLGLDKLLQANATGQWPRYATGGLVGFAGGGSVNTSLINRLAFGAQPDGYTQIGNANSAAAAAAVALAQAARVAAREQNDLNQATRSLSAVTKRHDAAVAGATRAATRDAAARESLARKQKAEEQALDDRIDAARKRVQRDSDRSDAQVEKLRRQQKQDDRKLDDQIEAARDRAGRDFGKSPAAQRMERNAQRDLDRLEAKRKRQDRSYEDRIQAAQDPNEREAKNLRELAALQERRDRMDRSHRDEMQRADTRSERSAKAREKAEVDRDKAVSAAQRTREKAEIVYERAADRQKAKADALKQATDDLAAANQRVADSAKQAADSFASQYRTGGDLADLIENRRTGIEELRKFNADIIKLTKAGLNQNDIDTIFGMGAAGSQDLLADIFAGGQAKVKELNALNAGLVSASQTLGMTQAREAYGVGKLVPLTAQKVPARGGSAGAGNVTYVSQYFTQVDPNAALIAANRQYGGMR